MLGFFELRIRVRYSTIELCVNQTKFSTQLLYWKAMNDYELNCIQ